MDITILQFLRGKRTRQILFNNLFISFILIGFSLLDEVNIDDFIFIIYIYLTLSFSYLNYGLLVFSWDSSYLKKILVISSRERYVKNKYTNLVFVGLVNCLYVAIISIVLFKKYFILILSLGIFNIGLLTPFLLLISQNNIKHVNIDKHRSWNFEGMSISYYVFYSLCIVFVAFVLISVEVISDSRIITYIVFTALGAVGFSIKKPIIKRVTHNIQLKLWKMQ
jgi:hypothetical protein